MNDRTNRLAFLYRLLESDEAGPPPRDDLDRLLRDWHTEHADAAAASRARILAATRVSAPRPSVLARIGRVVTSRSARVAASIAIVATMAMFLLNTPKNEAAAGIVQVAEGGELTAFSPDGERLGPCPLQHTDVDVEVSGPVTRVSIEQRYSNPHQQKIEAVYTFPLSHRSAVDQMRITVRGPGGERVVEGEVKERNLARQIYESARASGYVASLLEQERPNIFTQSVANIEPGATVIVRISYVELLQRRDGVYTFDFPTTVGPRYIPGQTSKSGPALPDGLVLRSGLVLLGPAQAELVGVSDDGAPLTAQAIDRLLATAIPVRTPSPEFLARSADLGPPREFTVTYANGSKEFGQFFADGIGVLNGRTFWTGSASAGGGFAQGTTQVPDAGRITPMPVKPPERAGHDLSMRVRIDSGGPAVREVSSALHEITTSVVDGRTIVELTQKNAIPNRDFALSWRTDGDAIGEGVLTHTRSADDATKGGYVALVLNPPARVNEAEIPPRELIFVLDTSGSMRGFPMEKAKEVMARAIAAMRPADTFNVITFAGQTRVLWDDPRPANDANKREAQLLVESQQGGGGTEMMQAIEAALRPTGRSGSITPAELADLPADGRSVRVHAPMSDLNEGATSLTIGSNKSIRVALGVALPTVADRSRHTLSLDGRWVTSEGDRTLVVDRASFERSSVSPTRIVMFLTDGYVGNDQAIVQAVRDHAKTTRVFSFGIGNNVNRFLLDEIAREGRGASETVFLDSDGDSAVRRFTRRLQSPVLVDIEASFAGIEIDHLIPDPARMPDLFDEEPIMLLGRYSNPGQGSMTIRGRTGAGDWERTIPVRLPAVSAANPSLPTLWARGQIDRIIAPQRAAIEQERVDPSIRAAIVALGEAYSIVSPFTSFVAVERGRVTVGGAPMLVRVPIELPEGTSWGGFFGESSSPARWLEGLSASRSASPSFDYSFADSTQPPATEPRVGHIIEELRATAATRSDALFFDCDLDEAKHELWSRAAGEAEHQSTTVLHTTTGSPAAVSATPPPASMGAPLVPLAAQPPPRPEPSNYLGLLKTGSSEAGPGGGAGFGGGGGFGAPGSPPELEQLRRSKEKAGAPLPAGGVATPLPSAAPAPPGDASNQPTLGHRAAAAPEAPSGGTTRTSPRGAADPSAADARNSKRLPAEAIPHPGAGTKLERIGGKEDSPRRDQVVDRDATKDDATDRTNRERAEQSTTSFAELADQPAADRAGSRAQPAQRVLTNAERNLLVRRLDRVLIALGSAAEIDPSRAIALGREVRPALDLDAEGRLRVSMLLGSDAESFQRAVDALTAIGVTIEATDPGVRVAVARVRFVDLIRIALLESVRRVEPFAGRAADR